MPSGITIEKDRGFAKTSDYCWVNIVVDGARVGKARVSPGATRVIICSIIIFPEFRQNGYARGFIDAIQQNYNEAIADRVRNTAVDFWVKMGFSPDNKGNYVWKRK